ncbi:MAG: tetratricopeptide repeat protein [Rhodopila sp.]|jgi:TPR repeat protein
MKTRVLIVSFVCLAAIVGAGGMGYRSYQIRHGISEYNDGNYSEALRCLSPFSGWGSPEAELALGEMYIFGLGAIEDDEKAIRLLDMSANSGNPVAQYSLGDLYQAGKKVKLDLAHAAELLKKSALQGYADAENDLGSLYSNGRGVDQDNNEAIIWFRKAAAHDSLASQYNLGLSYKDGTGVPMDDQKARGWFQGAAEKGYADAQYELGRGYITGLAGQKDAKVAASWLDKAANQGQADALAVLAKLYVDGDGVERNLVYGYALSNIAASLGTKIAAADNRNTIAAYLTPQQIQSAQGISSRWHPGLPLRNTTTPEDLAPQVLFATTVPPTLPSQQSYHDAVKATSVLFSKNFLDGGNEKYVVFLSTTWNGSHADGAYLSVATFAISDGHAELEQHWPSLQLQFTEIGSYGSAPDLVEMHKNYQFELVDGRVSRPAKDTGRNELIDLGGGAVMVLLDDYYAGMGTTTLGKRIFHYDGPNWVDVGFVATGEENSGENCGNDLPSKCYAWLGVIDFKKVEGSSYPDITLHLEGTEPDKNHKHVMPVPKSRTYRFDGKRYS